MCLVYTNKSNISIPNFQVKVIARLKVLTDSIFNDFGHSDVGIRDSKLLSHSYEWR